jgi:hypothetical protein
MRHPSFHEGSWEWHMRKHSLYHFLYHFEDFVSGFGPMSPIMSHPSHAMPNETSPATPSESQQFRKTPLKGHFRPPQAQSFSPPSSHTAVC